MTPILCCVFLHAACGNAEHKAEEKLKDEIFAIHDEVMPSTSQIVRLQRKIRSVKKKHNELTTAEMKALDGALLQLETAHDGMMLWMKNFKSPAKLRSSRSHAEIMLYLQTEKKSISEVRDAMLQSIAAGESATAKY